MVGFEDRLDGTFIAPASGSWILSSDVPTAAVVFESKTGSGVNVKLVNNNGYDQVKTGDLVWSTDGTTWSDFQVPDVYHYSAGPLSVAAKTTVPGYASPNSPGAADTTYQSFVVSGDQVALRGNWMALVDNTGMLTATNRDSMFRSTMSNNPAIVDVSDLSIKLDCGNSMSWCGALFNCGLTSIMKPENLDLSANGAQLYPDFGQFEKALNLVSACWRMPWTYGTSWRSSTQGNGSYSFNGCTSLRELSVMSHFGDGKWKADSLPSSGEAKRMLEGLALNCSSLSSVYTDITSFPDSGWQDWMKGVAANGTFYCPAALGTDETIERGVNYCPNGWTVVNI